MKKCFYTLGLVFASLFVAHAALANDVHCHVGGGLGYSVTTSEASLDAVGGPAGIAVIDGLSAEGVTPSLAAGCDFKSGRWLIGAGVDYAWHNADFKVSALNVPNLAELSVENQLSVTARAGYFVTEKTLVYGLVGWSRVETSDLSSPFFGASYDVGAMTGKVFGGGIEFDITEHIVAGLEYRYTDLDGETINIIPGVANVGLNSGIQTVQTRLKYRF